MLRFTLFGFPVSIHWLFWVTTALFGGGLNASTPEQIQRLLCWVVAAFLSIMLHELGHTFMMRKFGARASILLYSFGGLAIPDRGFTRKQQILVSLAGPVPQIVIGLIVQQLTIAAMPEAVLVRSFLSSFIWISIFWGLLNLVPIFPMDGGHVLNSVLGPRNAKITYTVSIVCAVGLGLLLLSLGSIFAPIFFGMMAYENFKRLRGDHSSSVLRPF